MDAIIAARDVERAAEVALATFMFSGQEKYTTERHIALCNALTEARDRTTAAERTAAGQIFGYDAAEAVVDVGVEPTILPKAAMVTPSPKASAASASAAVRRSKRLAATADKRAAAAAAQAAAEAELDNVLYSEARAKQMAEARAATIKKATDTRTKYVDQWNHTQSILDEALARMDAAYAEFKKNPADAELKYILRGNTNIYSSFARALERTAQKIQMIDAHIADL
jgi:hypothetical protein